LNTLSSLDIHMIIALCRQWRL